MRRPPGIELCEIPAGKYVVGADDGVRQHAIEPLEMWKGRSWTMPAQIVEIAEPFWISRDLITRNHQRRRHGLDPVEDDHIITATPENARLIAKDFGGRLPHWYEWEIAVRGPEPYLYPWGNTFDLAKLKLSSFDYSMDTKKDPAWFLDDFGAYANATSVFGLRDLARVGHEWNTLDDTHVVRSLCDVGAMTYSRLPGKREKLTTQAVYHALRVFSGPIAACLGVHGRPLEYFAALRIVIGAR